MQYGFGRQLPIIPPCLNDLNLPTNQFNILATLAVVNPTEDGHDENYSPQSPKLSEPSLISTPPMNLSTIDDWETPHTTTDDNSFYLEDEPKRVYWTYPLVETFISEVEFRRIYVLAGPSPPSPPHEFRDRNVFCKNRGSVAACLRSLRTTDFPKKGHSRTIY